MLLTTAVTAINQSRMSDAFKGFSSGSANPFGILSAIFSVYYFLTIFLMLLTFVAMKVVVIAYMKVYDEKGSESPTLAEVWPVFTAYFLKVLVYSVPVSIIITIGWFMCLVPGIYLWVVLAPFEALIIVENRSFGDAFSRCFNLVAKNFWMSLGIYVIGMIIYYFGSWILTGIAGMFVGFSSLFTLKDISNTTIIITSLLGVFGYVFYIIYLVAVNLNYYNLTEHYEGTGMLRKLDTFGNTQSGQNQPEEQY